MKLDGLLSPKSIALVGASAASSCLAVQVLDNLIQGGYRGELHCVFPEEKEVLGRKCLKDLGEIDASVDLCLIAVPAGEVFDVAERAVRAGAKAIVVYGAGFRESGPEGAEIERRLVELCRSRGVKLLGPNTVGLLNTKHQMNAMFAKQTALPGDVSIFSQSGALSVASLEWAAYRGMGISKLVSMGNRSDLDETAFLSAFGEDPETRVIVGYLENIASGNEFMKIAEVVASNKPVVILKAGTTKAGVRAASTHRGGLIEDDIAYAAAFKRSGIIRADTFEELFDDAAALSMQPLPKGTRVAVVTNAGGPGIMAADAIEQNGLRMAALSEETLNALSKILPRTARAVNFIDVQGDADPQLFRQVLNKIQEDVSVDALILILAPQAVKKSVEIVKELAGCVRGEKPVLAVFMGVLESNSVRTELGAAHIPMFPSPERAVVALKAMCEYATWKQKPPRIVTRFPVNRRRVERIIARQLRAGRVRVGEIKAKEILQAYDFSVPDGFLAHDAEEAIDAATRLGFPVVMKVVSPDIHHKSDVGGVRPSLSSPEEIRDAYDLMMLRLQRNVPHANIDGVYVEKMVPRGREVVIGMSRDPAFGPMLMFGLGGIFVEEMEDVTFHLAPITADEAMQMLKGTRSYALLLGAGGESAVDLASIATGLQRISQLVTDFPQIMELQINPFLVGEVGDEPVVVDADITLMEPGTKS
jgi:acetate---CoA ligase (ADP-forming)